MIVDQNNFLIMIASLLSSSCLLCIGTGKKIYLNVKLIITCGIPVFITERRTKGIKAGFHLSA